MFTTPYEQTALVYRCESHLEFATIAMRPMPPEELVDVLNSGTPVAIRRYSDDAVVEWWPNGLVKIVDPDGLKTYFWNKPTLADAVSYSKLVEDKGRGFFKFNDNGSVHGHCFGANYYWGPDLRMWVAPEMGEVLMSQQDMDGNWSFIGEDDYDEEDEEDEEAGDFVGCHCKH